MHKRNILSAALVVAGLLMGSGNAFAEYALNLTRGVTETSQEVYGLHMIILVIVCLIGIVVFGAMFYSILKHRKSKGAVAANFHESTTAEIAWTVVPILILVGMAIPATKTLLAMEDTSEADMTIKITGIQWKWKYDYLDEGISFVSSLDAASNKAREPGSGVDPNTVDNYLLNVDNPVVVPVGKKIRFLMTANDVIHSWWVPQLGWKKDAIPGFINEAWTKIDEPGTYRGQCAELCGKDHGFMPIVVVAKTEDEYRQWVAEQKGATANAEVAAEKQWTRDELMTKGKEVYSTCAACHGPQGQGMPGFPPLAGSAVATGPVEGHIDIVMNGKPGTAMAAYKTILSDVDLAAVITYERNSFGNTTGDQVQPSAIKAAR